MNFHTLNTNSSRYEEYSTPLHCETQNIMQEEYTPTTNNNINPIINSQNNLSNVYENSDTSITPIHQSSSKSMVDIFSKHLNTLTKSNSKYKENTLGDKPKILKSKSKSDKLKSKSKKHKLKPKKSKSEKLKLKKNKEEKRNSVKTDTNISKKSLESPKNNFTDYTINKDGIIIPNYRTDKNFMENKVDQIGIFWSVNSSLGERSIQLLKSLCEEYTPELLDRLIIPRSLKTLGANKEYVTITQVLNHNKCNSSDDSSNSDSPDRDSFNNLNNLNNKVLKIPSPENCISLRCLEWLVTNYAKKQTIILYGKKSNKMFNIFEEYGKQQKYYKRARFDPFCRNKRIYFIRELYSVYTHKKQKIVLLTTVAQLNFMMWIHKNGVLKYAESYKHRIHDDMEATNFSVSKEKKEYKKQNKKRKRKELSKPPNIKCKIANIPINLDFRFSSLFGEEYSEYIRNKNSKNKGKETKQNNRKINKQSNDDDSDNEEYGYNYAPYRKKQKIESYGSESDNSNEYEDDAIYKTSKNKSKIKNLE